MNPEQPASRQVEAATKRVSRWLGEAEALIYMATGVILVIAATALLGLTIFEMVREAMTGEAIAALLHLLDRTLLILMLAEIIYTVRRIAQTHRIEVTPFFIVAIIAAIRRMLIITAESTQNFDLQDSHFQAALAELGLLAVIILALAGAMRLVPSREQDRTGVPREDA